MSCKEDICLSLQLLLSLYKLFILLKIPFKIALLVVKMLKMWDSALYLYIKMLNFYNISRLKISEKLKQKAKTPNNDLFICKLIILLKNTCEM